MEVTLNRKPPVPRPLKEGIIYAIREVAVDNMPGYKIGQLFELDHPHPLMDGQQVTIFGLDDKGDKAGIMNGSHGVYQASGEPHRDGVLVFGAQRLHLRFFAGAHVLAGHVTQPGAVTENPFEKMGVPPPNSGNDVQRPLGTIR